MEINRLVIALPESQVWRLLRVIPGEQSFISQPARNPERRCDKRQTETQVPDDCLDDWLP